MTVAQFLATHKCDSVDYTYYHNGETYYDYLSVNRLQHGGWDVPSGILNAEIIDAKVYKMDFGEILAAINCKD